MDLLAMVGLGTEFADRYPHQLSGGQRQRIMVARALLLRPRIILADEPVSMVDASLRATILKSLRSLRDEMGISVVYISHDLATAYHISERIVVLYQGSVVEAGDVDGVISAPEHPYTQLLVGSIPWPDPKRRWGDVETSASSRIVLVPEGCAFAPRCSHAMDECRQVRPPLFRTEEARAVACYLCQDSPAMENAELGLVLSARASG